MASHIQILINSQGWLYSFKLIAYIFLGITVLGIFIIPNPPHGRWEPPKKEDAESVRKAQAQQQL